LGKITVRGGSADPEGGSEFVDGQLAGASGFSVCRTALTPKFQFKHGQRGHDRGDREPGGGGGVDAFAYGKQQDSPLTEVGDGAGDTGNQRPKRSMAVTTMTSPGRA
jgi:hypothetical protein